MIVRITDKYYSLQKLNMGEFPCRNCSFDKDSSEDDCTLVSDSVNCGQKEVWRPTRPTTHKANKKKMQFFDIEYKKRGRSRAMKAINAVKNEKIVMQFNSIRECATYYQTSYSAVSYCLKHKTKFKKLGGLEFRKLEN